MGLKITVINHRKISEPQLTDDAEFLNYQEMLDYTGYFNGIFSKEVPDEPK